MKLDRLISNTKYGKLLVLNTPVLKFAEMRVLYDEFLDQNIELWMCVPCKLINEVWISLKKEKAQAYNKDGVKIDYAFEKDDYVLGGAKEYQEAEKLCLFKGFYSLKDSFITNGSLIIDSETMSIMKVENLIQYGIELTPTAQKQLGYEC